MMCARCKSENVKKNGNSCGKQRYYCKECGKTFFNSEAKYTNADKRRAVLMYLNNCGVRKTALFIGCSRTTVTNWVRQAKRELDRIIEDFEPDYSEIPDIIELDEIYTFIQKKGGGQSFGLLTLGTQSVLLRLSSATKKIL